MAHACYAAKARAGSYVPCTLSLGAEDGQLPKAIPISCYTVLCLRVLHCIVRTLYPSTACVKRTVRMSCKPEARCQRQMPKHSQKHTRSMG